MRGFMKRFNEFSITWDTMIERHALQIAVVLSMMLVVTFICLPLYLMWDTSRTILKLTSTIISVQEQQDWQRREIKTLDERTKSLTDEQKWIREQEPVSRGVRRGSMMLITAYTCGPESTDKSPGDPGYCITAPDPKTGKGYKLSNADAWKVVAADPKYHAAGSRLYIEGVGEVVVWDTGGAIKGPNRLDLFVGETDVRAAMNWGRRTKEVAAR